MELIFGVVFLSHALAVFAGAFRFIETAAHDIAIMDTALHKDPDLSYLFGTQLVSDRHASSARAGV
ncbi:MAG: hypothetical protein ACRESX_02360 [Gammaproteobacteria bacterium]